MEGTELRALEVTVIDHEEIQAVREALRATRWYIVVERIVYAEDFAGDPKRYILTAIAPPTGERLVPRRQLEERKASCVQLEAFAMRATPAELRKDGAPIIEAATAGGWWGHEVEAVPFLQYAQGERWRLFFAAKGTDLPDGVRRDGAA